MYGPIKNMVIFQLFVMLVFMTWAFYNPTYHWV